MSTTVSPQAGNQEGKCATEKIVHVFIESCGQRKKLIKGQASLSIFLYQLSPTDIKMHPNKRKKK